MSVLLSSVDVATIADGLATVSVSWDVGVANPPTTRQFERILATDAYDAWLIYWPPGTGVDLHDHGDSIGAFSVVVGALTDETPVQRTTVTRTIAEGETLFLPANHVHAVRNLGETAVTSVHVYSPPLRSMGFYRDEDGGLVLDRLEETAR